MRGRGRAAWPGGCLSSRRGQTSRCPAAGWRQTASRARGARAPACQGGGGGRRGRARGRYRGLASIRHGPALSYNRSRLPDGGVPRARRIKATQAPGARRASGRWPPPKSARPPTWPMMAKLHCCRTVASRMAQAMAKNIQAYREAAAPAGSSYGSGGIVALGSAEALCEGVGAAGEARWAGRWLQPGLGSR